MGDHAEGLNLREFDNDLFGQTVRNEGTVTVSALILHGCHEDRRSAVGDVRYFPKRCFEDIAAARDSTYELEFVVPDCRPDFGQAALKRSFRDDSVTPSCIQELALRYNTPGSLKQINEYVERFATYRRRLRSRRS